MQDIEILVYPVVACKGTIADTGRPYFPRHGAYVKMAGGFGLCWTHLKFGTRHAGTPAETGWLPFGDWGTNMFLGPSVFSFPPFRKGSEVFLLNVLR